MVLHDPLITWSHDNKAIFSVVTIIISWNLDFTLIYCFPCWLCQSLPLVYWLTLPLYYLHFYLHHITHIYLNILHIFIGSIFTMSCNLPTLFSFYVTMYFHLYHDSFAVVTSYPIGFALQTVPRNSSPLSPRSTWRHSGFVSWRVSLRREKIRPAQRDSNIET